MKQTGGGRGGKDGRDHERRRNASVTSVAPVAVESPDTTGITEREARLAVRATALFTPDAMLT